MTVLLDGSGNCIEIEDGVVAIGSGGLYATSAARGMLDNDKLTAEQIAQRSMKIAADLCIYTNHNTICEVLESEVSSATVQLPLLGYWNVRGKGHQIKYLLAHLGVEYAQEVYKHGETRETAMKPWTQKKHFLGLDFPNLPYFIDGDVHLTESKSIMKYLCRKHDPAMLGRDAAEIATADMVSRVHDDLHAKYGAHAFKTGDTPKLHADLD